MGAKGAVEIIFRGKNVVEETANYEYAFASPLKAAERGYVDDIIMPEETRKYIANDLVVLRDKQRPKIVRKHSNMPL